MKKLVYFDNAASAIPLPEALETMRESSAKYFANSEAGHFLAHDVRRSLADAGRRLSEVFFGSGDYPVIWGESASELFRVLASFAGFDRSAAAELEHPALLANLKKFTSLTLLGSDRDGMIKCGGIVHNLPLLCCHQVQSELGSMPDCTAFFASCKAQCRMIDAVQAAGKIPLVKDADIWVISGVKFGSPGGAAMLLSPRGKFTDALLEHSDNCRKTEYSVSRHNVPMLLAMVRAAEISVASMKENLENVSAINHFIREGTNKMGIIPTMSEGIPVSPYILNLMLPEQESAVVVRALGMLGIAVASGSACSAESGKPSPALRALGIRGKMLYHSLRLSFSAGNTMDDAEIFLSGLKTVLKNY